MWIGLFSDIHANREALEACLEHARRDGIGRYVFLGDYVGYGADPGFVVDTVMREVESGAVALLGNHDAAIASGTARHESQSPRKRSTGPGSSSDGAQREFLTDCR